MFLKSLLAALTPKDTVLLPNYPNPFNPETWIPYHLAAATDVQITIYDATGGVVRRLDLGHQSAGYYTARSRAAYWDGKNALGESVASGIYFYQLQADTVSHLRKMLILK
ncbi:T9SS type A sorting domain-containing protein [Candidatus Poribacteria bacterium]|nr:T9SS type A sorting domain-containing protein [Candidatus Poribacteria bacterium]